MYIHCDCCRTLSPCTVPAYSCAGLLNLRGKDVEFNPVFYSYVIVTMDSVKSVLLSQLQ